MFQPIRNVSFKAGLNQHKRTRVESVEVLRELQAGPQEADCNGGCWLRTTDTHLASAGMNGANTALRTRE